MNIQLKSVGKEYTLGKTTVSALRDASLTVEQGEYVTITGPSGSGKSTLLHLMGALDQPTSGEILMDGEPVNKLDDSSLARIRRDRIGFIFQSFNLIPVLSVYGNVEFPLILKKTPKKERRDRVLAILDRVGLGDRADHKTEELSGGQRQRVAIARALVTNPSVILSDEPTANLDSKTGREIIELMQTLNDEQRVTLVFATHDRGIVADARRVISVLDGRILEDKIVSKETCASVGQRCSR
ncbi:MAG: ABC transporter ATP-binding protein [Nitrospinae bacterium]|nr:ABC transporter ATP-binding protein [Nitrospinota bacterium]